MPRAFAQARAMIGVTLAVTAALLGRPSAAWGPLGHHAVGAVADTLLSRARASKSRACCWTTGTATARHRDAPRWPTCRCGPMKYAAAKPTGPAGTTTTCPRVAPSHRDPTGAPCNNVPALASSRCWRCWATARAPCGERNEALKWIVHLVGDLHQPLHAADYAQGATLVPVQLAGRPDRTSVTLHGAWDVRLVAASLHAGRSLQPSDGALRGLLKGARAATAAMREARAAQWALESNRLARQVALDYPGFRCDGVPTQPVVLSAGYQQRAQRVIRSQLALAGARLAAMLNRVLAGP